MSAVARGWALPERARPAAAGAGAAPHSGAEPRQSAPAWAFAISMALHLAAFAALGPIAHGTARHGDAAPALLHVFLVPAPAVRTASPPRVAQESAARAVAAAAPAPARPPRAPPRAPAPPAEAPSPRPRTATPAPPPAAAPDPPSSAQAASAAPSAASVAAASAVAGSRDGGMPASSSSHPTPSRTPAATGAAYRDAPEPEYPESAREDEMEGLVVLRVRISAEGRPLEIALRRSSGYGVLDRAALRAVRRWTFVAATRGGRPVASWMDVPVRFRLRG